MPSDPRMELSDRIARAWGYQSAFDVECNDDHDCDLLVKVMELFPEVRTEQVVPFRGASVHTVIAARTAPEPIGDDHA